MTNHLTQQEVDARLRGFDDCLKTRQAVTNECFGGVTDERHQREENDLRTGKKNTLVLKKELQENV